MTEHDPFDTSGYIRRCRRTVGLAQRAMAERVGMAQQTLARVETGQQDLRVREFAALVRSAGLRLVLLDEDGTEIAPMRPDPVRDAAGRRFPAHVDVRHGDEDWWHGEHRHSREPPTYTFDLGHEVQDDDHPQPAPGDDLRTRREARRRAAEQRRRDRLAERHRQVVSGEIVLEPYDLLAMCECPPGCEELLVGDDPAGQLDPHVTDCPCRCDIH